jgi:hypothetical protein
MGYHKSTAKNQMQGLFEAEDEFHLGGIFVAGGADTSAEAVGDFLCSVQTDAAAVYIYRI